MNSIFSPSRVFDEVKRSLYAIFYDPLAEEDLAQFLLGFIGELKCTKNEEEILEFCRAKERHPDLLIVREREGMEERFHRLFRQLERDHGSLPIFYLYENDPLYAEAFATYRSLSFLSCPEKRSLCAATLRHFLYGILYRKAAFRYRKTVQNMEKSFQRIREEERRQLRTFQQEMEVREALLTASVKELQTPIEGLLGVVELLKKNTSSDEQNALLKKIEDSGKILTTFIRDLGNFPELYDGKMELLEEEFDFNDILDMVASAVGYLADSKGLRLIFDIERNVPACMTGDPLHLAQVLTTLLGHAISVTEKGNVVLKVSMETLEGSQETLLVEVLDSSASDELFSVDRPWKNRVEQRDIVEEGVGMMIATFIIGLMGGKLEVEKIHGQGNRFHFTFPTRRKDRRSYRLPSKELMYKRALILDDNPASAGALAKMLRYFHYGTVMVDSVEELQHVLKSSDYDIVLVDETIESEDFCDENCWSRQNQALFVALRSEYEVREARQRQSLEYVAVLKKPLTQKRVFELIVDLYTRNEIEASSDEVEVLSEGMLGCSGKKILVVDGDPIDHALLVLLLGKLKIETLFAETIEEAVENLEWSGETIDLILIHGELEYADEAKAEEEIRSLKKITHVPIVAMTKNEIECYRLKRIGIDDCFPKLIDVERFYRSVGSMLTECTEKERKSE